MADMTCETVLVQRKVSEDNPTGVVVINKVDFVEGVDKLFETAKVEAEIEQIEESAPVAPWNVK